MGERTSHPPGTLSWADLATTDAEAAKRFYAAILGWEFEDLPVGEGQVYSMARVDGLEVAALSQMGDQPPHWNVYVTVEEADAAAARAAELGGRVLVAVHDRPPFRSAVIADPEGAAFSVSRLAA